MTVSATSEFFADVFTGVLGTAILANGATAVIVAAGADHLDAVRDFYGELSDTSTYYRFFAVRRAIPERELQALVTIRLPGHVALLVYVGVTLIGIGEYTADRHDPREAEVAFAVADDHHREGVATLMLERLAIVAHRCGLETFTAFVLPGNGDMQLVFRTVGLPVESRWDEAGAVVDVTLDITDLDHLHELSAERHHQACIGAARRRSVAPEGCPPIERCATCGPWAGLELSADFQGPGPQVADTTTAAMGMRRQADTVVGDANLDHRAAHSDAHFSRTRPGVPRHVRQCLPDDGEEIVGEGTIDGGVDRSVEPDHGLEPQHACGFGAQVGQFLADGSAG